MNIAIIPARGGSKRILRKNIRHFCGKPIIAYSIETALKSGCFDRVIVSTDCEEIALIAESYGAHVPFIRPAELSDDLASTRGVVNHAINWVTDNLINPEYVCCLYATAPFITVETLQQSYKQLQETGKKFCFTITSFPFPIQRALYIDDNGNVQMFYPQHRQSRSQDLTEAYHDAGQFYWGRSEAFLSGKTMYSEHSTAYILPRYQVQDIDTEEDWIFAEYLFKSGL